jgi:hypothetical protein
VVKQRRCGQGFRKATSRLICLAVLSSGLACSSRPLAHVSLKASGRRFPIIWEGDTLSASAPISTISFFQPRFGPERVAVNPERPRMVSPDLLRFDRPGEYYLILNRDSFAKVLVLAKSEPASSAVLRIFDFCVANHVFYPWKESDDEEFYRDQGLYIDRLFSRKGDMWLSCTTTHTVLMRLVADALELPTRRPTFMGAFKWEGNISIDAHNPLEIYLPDKGKWVLFDVNLAFVPEWLSALETCEYFNRNSTPYHTGFIEEPALTSLDIHEAPRSFLPGVNSDRPAYPYRLISTIPAVYTWPLHFRFFYGGVAYWGDHKPQNEGGTDFLAGDAVWASLEVDPCLEEAVRRHARQFGFEMTTVSPGTLESLLAEGHCQAIAQAGWRSKLPDGPVLESVTRLPPPACQLVATVGPPTVSVTASPTLPQAEPVPITWVAHASGGLAPFRYQFVLCTESSGDCSVVRPYSASDTWSWTPSAKGQYVVQVLVKNHRSVAAFDASASSSYVRIGEAVQAPPVSAALKVVPAQPLRVGRKTTWTAQAKGGSPPFQYAFLLYTGSTRSWSLVRPYSDSNSFEWTPASSGEYAVQVWVRNHWSAADYDAWNGSGPFKVTSWSRWVLRSLRRLF